MGVGESSDRNSFLHQKGEKGLHLTVGISSSEIRNLKLKWWKQRKLAENSVYINSPETNPSQLLCLRFVFIIVKVSFWK